MRLKVGHSAISQAGRGRRKGANMPDPKARRREADIKGSGGASITVKENLAGSLVGDIAHAASGGRPVDDDHMPVAQVHEMRRPKDLPSYKEEPVVTVMTRFGKLRRSAYTDGS